MKNFNLVDKEHVAIEGRVCMFVDFYELYEENDIRRFYPRRSEWSDPGYDLLTFPYGDFPPEFTSKLPNRDGKKHRIIVKDWNTGKINEKKRGTCEDNFVDPVQGRITGVNDIWEDHPEPRELANLLEPIDKDLREEAFKFFGYIKSYASVFEKEKEIPYKLLVDFEPEDSIAKAILGKIKSGAIKFFGSDKIFQISDIDSLSVIIKDGHPFLDIVLKSDLLKEKEEFRKRIKNLEDDIKDLEDYLKQAKADNDKILSEKEYLNKKVVELEKNRPKEGEITFIVRKDDFYRSVHIGDFYEIKDKEEMNIPKIGTFIGIKMIKRAK